MKISQITYITQVPLSSREIQSFGPEFFLSQGLGVSVWECSGFLNSKVHAATLPTQNISLKSISSPEAAAFLAGQCSSADAVVNLLPRNRKTLSVFAVLNNSPAANVEVRTNAVPAGPGQLSARLRKLSPGRVVDFIVRNPKIWQKLAGIPGRIIYGGAVMRPAPGECGRAISAHALDYDVWLEFLAGRGLSPADARSADSPAARPKHIVFLDQNLPFHGDFAIQKRRVPATEERYFPALRRFFDRLEQDMGLPVVIAAHPRARYSQAGYSGPDYFGGRGLISGQTLPLIFDSALALTHYSTAVNFAVMAQKPLLLLSSNEIERSEGHIIRSMGAHLGAPIVNIDRPDEFFPAGLPQANQEAYARYFHNYIKEEGSPEKPFWQILLDDLQNRA